MCSNQGVFFLLEWEELFPLEHCLYKSQGENREKGDSKKMWNSVQILVAYKNPWYKYSSSPRTHLKYLPKIIKSYDVKKH